MCLPATYPPAFNVDTRTVRAALPAWSLANSCACSTNTAPSVYLHHLLSTMSKLILIDNMPDDPAPTPLRAVLEFRLAAASGLLLQAHGYAATT
jgi:hypothetical protein